MVFTAVSQSELSLTAQSMLEVTANVVVPEVELTERDEGDTLNAGVAPDWFTVTT